MCFYFDSGFCPLTKTHVDLLSHHTERINELEDIVREQSSNIESMKSQISSTSLCEAPAERLLDPRQQSEPMTLRSGRQLKEV